MRMVTYLHGGRVTVFAAVFVVTGSCVAGAQQPPSEPAAPFGVKIGAQKTQVGAIKREIAPFLYELTSVPRPHRKFESYFVEVVPSTGVCFIKGVSVSINSSAYGTQLQAAFDEIKDQLAEVYGPAVVTDELSSGSIWNEPRDWMMGLREKERTLLAHWAHSDGSVLRPGLQEVYLAAKAVSGDTGYLVVEYYSEKYKECEAEAKRSESKVF